MAAKRDGLLGVLWVLWKATVHLFYLTVALICESFFDSRSKLGTNNTLPWNNNEKEAKNLEDEAEDSIPAKKKGVEWVRPLGAQERLLKLMGDFGHFNTVQALWLATDDVTFTVQDVKAALKHLVSETDVLQSRIRSKFGRLWFTKEAETQIDFAFVQSREIMPTFYEQMDTPLPVSGGIPWRFRLIAMPDDTPNNVDSLSQMIYTEQLSHAHKTFEWKKSENDPKLSTEPLKRAVVIMCLHHSITDATSNMVLSNRIISILNDILMKRTVVSAPMPFQPALTDSLIWPSSLEFLASYTWAKVRRMFFCSFSTAEGYFHGGIPVPEEPETITRFFTEILSVEATKSLLQQCRREGVTLHSCMTALVNVTLMKVAYSEDKDAIQVVSSSHAVSSRRWFDEDQKNGTGCHIMLEEMNNETAMTDRDDFWQYAKKIHNNLHSDLFREYIPRKIYPLTGFLWPLITANIVLDTGKIRTRMDNHYITTNMGNLREWLPPNTSPVKVTHTIRSCTMECVGSMFSFTFQTHNDRLQIQIDCFKHKLSPKTALKIFDELCCGATTLAKTGSL